MKKNYGNVIYNRCFLLVIILMVSAISLKAQRPLPHMWVAKDNGIARRACFRNGTNATGSKSKYKLLTAKLGFPVTDSIICPVDGLKNFIDNLGANVTIIRFYLAAYNSAYGTIPPGHNKDLTLIMAPCTGSITGPGTDNGVDYYNITPSGVINKIDPNTAKGWTSYYNNVNGIMGELDKTINAADPDNIDKRPNRKPSDTQNCDYLLSDFKEFLDSEIVHQDSIPNKITGIQIDFCSYTSEGHTECPDNHFKDRLILQFEYTHKSGANNYEVFYLEDQHEGRKPQQPICNGFMSADNGLLCPSNCPSPPTP